MHFKNAVLRSALAVECPAFATSPKPLLASSHREAPITALDQKAAITDCAHAEPIAQHAHQS
jgi:hypothetical protein